MSDPASNPLGQLLQLQPSRDRKLDERQPCLVDVTTVAGIGGTAVIPSPIVIPFGSRRLRSPFVYDIDPVDNGLAFCGAFYKAKAGGLPSGNLAIWFGEHVASGDLPPSALDLFPKPVSSHSNHWVSLR